MHRAEQAILLAAGYGKRLEPFTEKTPKPLLEIGGVRIIERLIESLLQWGIADITVVTGYRKECFSYLPGKYSYVRLCENPAYCEGNNILSLHAARHILKRGSVMILDADQWIYDASILNPCFTSSCYLASYVQGDTEEWLLQLDGDRIVSCARDGGADGWRLYSVSLWTAEDAVRLADSLERDAYAHRELYWDDVALFLHRDAFCLSVRKICASALCEIDTVEELCAIEPLYARKLSQQGGAP